MRFGRTVVGLLRILFRLCILYLVKIPIILASQAIIAMETSPFLGDDRNDTTIEMIIGYIRKMKILIPVTLSFKR